MKDYLQRRYLEQISEHQTRKETFLKCRSDDLSYRCLKRQPNSGFVQSSERLGHDHSSYNNSLTVSSIHKIDRNVKSSSFDSSSVLQHSVSDTNLCCALSASDTHFIQSQSNNISRSQSKRGLLQRCATIDMEDTPASNQNDEQMVSSPTSPINDEKLDAGRIIFSIDRPDDEDEHQQRTKSTDRLKEEHPNQHDLKSQLMQINSHRERKSRPFRHSHSDQPVTDLRMKTTNNNFLSPFRHSFEQQMIPHDNRTLPIPLSNIHYQNPLSIPLAPYSAASDPGPYQSPWGHTPTNPYGLVNFQFPKSQDHLVASAQGTINQLSNLTQILCDEPSVFTPITPR